MYIEIDGPDGSYKSSLINKLAAKLEAEGKKVHMVRQPGGTKIAEVLRDLVKFGHDGEVASPLASFHMFMASRLQLHDIEISKYRGDGYIVLSDRGNFSSVAYQGYGLNVPMNLVESCIKAMGPERKPDLIMRIDIDYELSMRRQGDRGTTDLIEKLGEDFHRKVINGFRTYPNTELLAKKYVTIPGVLKDGTELSSSNLADIAFIEVSKL